MLNVWFLGQIDYRTIEHPWIINEILLENSSIKQRNKKSPKIEYVDFNENWIASHISQREQSISAKWIIISLSEMQIFMNIREEIFISFQSGKDFHKIERNAF